VFSPPRACSGNDEPSAADPGPVHVHALSVDPANRSLFIATHTGLYRLEDDAQRAECIGDRNQDTMGFTVAGPNHESTRVTTSSSPVIAALQASRAQLARRLGAYAESSFAARSSAGISARQLAIARDRLFSPPDPAPHTEALSPS
jgi:hypothetical protein